MESLRQTCFQNPIYKPSLSYCLKKLNKGTRMQSHILHPSYRQRDVFVQHIFQKRTCCNNIQLRQFLVKVPQQCNSLWRRLYLVDKKQGSSRPLRLIIIQNNKGSSIFTSSVDSNKSFASFFSRFKDRKLSNSLPNCSTIVVFPTWRAPLNIRGFLLFSLPTHATDSVSFVQTYRNLFIYSYKYTNLFHCRGEFTHFLFHCRGELA